MEPLKGDGHPVAGGGSWHSLPLQTQQSVLSPALQNG